MERRPDVSQRRGAAAAEARPIPAETDPEERRAGRSQTDAAVVLAGEDDDGDEEVEEERKETSKTGTAATRPAFRTGLFCGQFLSKKVSETKKESVWQIDRFASDEPWTWTPHRVQDRLSTQRRIENIVGAYSVSGRRLSISQSSFGGICSKIPIDLSFIVSILRFTLHGERQCIELQDAVTNINARNVLVHDTQYISVSQLGASFLSLLFERLPSRRGKTLRLGPTFSSNFTPMPILILSWQQRALFYDRFLIVT